MIASPTSSGPPAFQFKPSRQPMLWVAGAYSLGIVAGVYAWRPAVWWVVAVAVFGAAAGYFVNRRSGVAWLLALVTFFLAGALHIQMRSASPRLDTGILPYADRREIQVTAHVTREGRIQPGGFGELRQTLDLESEQVQTPDGLIVPIHSGIRVSIYSPRYARRLPALRYVSHSGRVGNERKHSCFRCFLDATPPARRERSRNAAHGSLLRRLCIHHRSRRARVACHADVRRLPGHPAALSRPRDDQCAGRRCVRTARLRSAAALHRQLPDDILMRADRCGDWHPHAGAHLATLPPGARELGFEGLRRAAATARGTVPSRPADNFCEARFVCRKHLGCKVDS